VLFAYQAGSAGVIIQGVRTGRNDIEQRVLSALAAVVLAVAGCERARAPGPPAGRPDGGDGGGAVAVADGAVRCASDEQCDDGVECTRDLCSSDGYCANMAESNRCADGVFCNGNEICDPLAGCIPGIAFTCDDGNVCTMDSCQEEAKSCLHLPRDFDGDGEVDWHCAGGTDCDDCDPTRGARVNEVCGDGIDNDCDEEVDEPDCGRADYDLCEDAYRISGGGEHLLSLRGASADYALGCATTGMREVAVRLSLEEESDLTLTARGRSADGEAESTALSLRRDCQDILSEIECASGVDVQARLRTVEAGEYFVLVAATAADQVTLLVELDEPSQAPGNPTCDSPLDVSDGGRFLGDFVDVSDDYAAACGFGDSADLTYRFTLQEKRDVLLSATATEDAQRMNVDVRETCEDPDSSLRCLAGFPAQGRLYSLAAGTYYLVVEGPSYREIDFDLDISFHDPGPPPPGDSCAEPAALPPDTPLYGDLADKQDLAETGCGHFYRDTIYGFDVEEPIDLLLRADGGESVMVLAVQESCGDPDSELLCTSGRLALKRLRNLDPGRYYVVVESAANTSFVIMAEPLPVTVPQEVEGNERCATAAVIGEQGGLFAGDTSTMDNDYSAGGCGSLAQSKDAAFKLVLGESRRVIVELEADFDAVLYRFTEVEGESATCVSREEDACDDDGGPGTDSLLDEQLEAGVHYFIVDGFGKTNDGSYTLAVTVE
jgi:hypothetical protein